MCSLGLLLVLFVAMQWENNMDKRIEDTKFNNWQSGLLDISKRNRMINYKKTKTSTLEITYPSMADLYHRIAENSEKISFKKKKETGNSKVDSFFFLMNKLSSPVELCDGEIASDLPTDDMNTLLKQLRAKANLSLEEQGINILYLSCGFLEWKPKPNEESVFSPLVLIPVTLEISSITKPYVISRSAEDVVVNPTLEYALAQDSFKIQLPDLETTNGTILDFLNSVQTLVSPLGWHVTNRTSLGLLSFLKIVIYKDLEKNRSRIFANPVIRALCGDFNALTALQPEGDNFDHDKIEARETHQVVTADASQQDAILLSKKGKSFVLQGPPGTGKSQTITNIIAEALADGKKVLFVSEKTAALSIVYKRLKEVGLAEYCLSLHNYKAEKKQVIQELVQCLDAPRQDVLPGIDNYLVQMENERRQLNSYVEELHKIRLPFNSSLYGVISELSTLAQYPNYFFTENTLTVDENVFQKYFAALNTYTNYLKQMHMLPQHNPWRNSTITEITFLSKQRIMQILSPLQKNMDDLYSAFSELKGNGFPDRDITWKDACCIISLVNSRKIQYCQAKTAESFFASLFRVKPTDEDVSDILREYDQIVAVTKSAALPLNRFDSLEERLELIRTLQSEQAVTKEIIGLLYYASEELGCAFTCSPEGIKELKQIAEIAISYDRIEDNWILPHNYSAACSVLKDTAGTLRSIGELQNTLDLSIPSELRKQSSTLSKCPLSEVIQFFSENIKTASTLYNNLTTQYSIVLNNDETKESVNCISAINTSIENIDKEIQSVDTAINFINDFNRCMSASVDKNDFGLSEIQSFLCLLSAEHNLIPQWITARDFNSFFSLINQMKPLCEKINRLKDDLASVWTTDIYKLDETKLLERFRIDYTSFFKRMGSQYKADLRSIILCQRNISNKPTNQDCLNLLDKLREYRLFMEDLNVFSNEAKKSFGDLYTFESTDWNEIESSLDLGRAANSFYQIIGMTEPMIKLCCDSISNRQNYLIGKYPVSELIKNNFCEKLRNEVLFSSGADFAEICKLLNVKRSNLETLKTTYRKAVQYIASGFSTSAETIDAVIPETTTYEEINACLHNFVALANTTRDYKRTENRIIEYFPSLFNGVNTDWSIIENLLQQSKKLHQYTSTHAVSMQLRSFLSSPAEIRRNKTIQSVPLVSLVNGEYLAKYSSILSQCPGSFDDFLKTKESLIAALSEMSKLSEQLQFYLQEPYSTISFSECVSLLKDYAEIGSLLENGKNQQAKQAASLGITADTDFIEYYTVFAPWLNDESQYLLNSETTLSISVEASSTLTNHIKSVLFEEKESSSVKELKEQLTVFSNYFETGEFSSFFLSTLRKRLAECSDFSSLAEWIGYRELRAECIHQGLQDYLCFLDAEKIVPDDIWPCFYKGFLNRWYEDIINENHLSNIRRFYPVNQESLISSYETHDHQHLKTTQAILRANLSQQRPSNFTVMAKAMDEVSILRREAERKTRVMPLRKLFKSIPITLQKLKPCFMMSPLSVSYFLDSDIFQFDMVIFDEASQILPEDAVGAIYRGKQTIVAGDRKQMPPTNFFTASIRTNDDYDVDEDEDAYYENSYVAESILEESDGKLPSCMMKWHYRSRDESLIAFSNREIYNNKLITFPNCRKEKDKGLEFIYVPNGVYEGKPKNCNINEAKRIVQLVEEHILTHPERSLGIVAFSEKQQAAIEREIVDWRLSNPQYESFFEEDKEEAFFVKNLENVQGDERDTIIFSICYAKNSSGTMYMRFGPLSLAGGERRLNVAITRAKYNVKLVGSIYPNDLRLSEKTPRGVQLLAGYISYAMENDYSITDSISQNSSVDSFADFVANYITDNGYKVLQNVGASNYKVDIAVVDPNDSDRFCAGIECDGANYTSARTVRDRDITRKTKMKEIGWNLYHVWSVAWQANPEIEGKNLLRFLQNSCSAALIPQTNNSIDDNEFIVQDMLQTVSSIKKTEPDFEIYETCSIPSGLCLSPRILAGIIERIIRIESPVHRDVIFQRVGNIARKEITDTALSMLKSSDILQKNNFYYYSGKQILPRKPRFENQKRSIEHIAPGEIQKGIIAVLRCAYSLTEKDLINETARAFGYSQTRQNIKNSITANYQALLRINALRVVDEKVYLGENNV